MSSSATRKGTSRFHVCYVLPYVFRYASTHPGQLGEGHLGVGLGRVKRVFRPGLDVSANLEEEDDVVEAPVLRGDVERVLAHLQPRQVGAVVDRLRVEPDRRQGLKDILKTEVALDEL